MFAAEPGDSGRYGVMATNAAGRAESLADVMVTPLVMEKAPPTHKITFTDISDDAKVRLSPRCLIHLMVEGNTQGSVTGTWQR